MKAFTFGRVAIAAMALGLAACSQGGDIASPGATSPGTPPGGGGGGGGGSGGGTATCPAGTTNAGAVGSFTACNVTGEILQNLTLPRLTGVVYRINGRVDVGRDLGAAGNASTGTAATLTIEPGVTLFGDVAGDILIVNRGSQIQAVGTATDPIVFTSREDVAGTVVRATDTRQWGGVIVLGRAPVRDCATAVAQGSVDCQNAIEGVTAATGRQALYGGATPADNSGRLRYVSIRHSSDFLTSAAAGDDLNGLTLGGVGSGTEVNYVQVHNSGDDGIEWFGGTVNSKYLVITGALDDSLDYDAGWTGKVQYAVVQQALTATGGPDRLIEASNRVVASLPGTLNTNPTFSNFTFVGLRTNQAGGNLQGISLNNTGGTPGAATRFLNGVVTGSNVCVEANNSNTSPAPRFDSVLFDCPTALTGTAATLVAAGANNSTTVPNSLTNYMPGPAELGRTAVNPSTVDAFFDAAAYVGAFSPTMSATSNWASGWTISLFAPPAACPAGTTETGTVNGQRNCRLPSVIGAAGTPTSIRLVAGNLYQINGRTDVGEDRGAAGTAGIAATLTVDAGVTIYGNQAADILVVNRGSQIFINGTPTQPVVMTSLADVTNIQGTPATATREWGGFIVLGRAPIRDCATAVAQGSVDCQNAVEGVTAATGRQALYGGATPNDSSGRISYLQQKYSGAFLTSAAAGDDLNGITLGGVGSGTEINYVQVHNSGDDGIEWFGGTVNHKNIVITGALDDSLDYDAGWVGNVQFVIVEQALTATGGPDRLIEASNRIVAALPGTLNTNPTFANFTFRGLRTNQAGGNLQGISLNNTGGTPGASSRFLNGVVTGSNVCVEANNSNPNPAPQFDSMLFDCPTPLSGTAATLVAAGANNTTAIANTLTSRFINGSAEAGRVAVNPATVSPFFTATSWIGAVRDSADSWWRGWTCGLETGSTC